MNQTSSPKHRWAWKLPFLVLLMVGTAWIIRQHTQEQDPTTAGSYQKDSGSIFGTFYHITYQSPCSLQKEIEQTLADVDHSLSPFNKESIISALNNNTHMEVDEMFEQVFRTAMQISEQTDGDFDITVSPLVNLWGFGFKNDIRPDSASVDSLRQLVGYQKVHLEGRTLHKDDDRIMLDCSSIAKGFGVDKVAEMLRNHGVTNFMVEIGGEVVTQGESEQQRPWRIGISKPVDDPTGSNQELEQILSLNDEALATSGNYRNFRIENGQKYAHTINPHTGYPVQHNLLSATVIAKDCMTADGYATAFMVMGLQRSIEFLAQHPELSAYLIYTDGEKDTYQVYHTPSLEAKFAR